MGMAMIANEVMGYPCIDEGGINLTAVHNHMLDGTHTFSSTIGDRHDRKIGETLRAAFDNQRGR
jgi:hypothetical protein